jgi:ribonuclease VapC
MIAVDSSIVVAIMRDESDARIWTEVLDQASKSLMSVVSYVETNMVIAGRRPNADSEQVGVLLRALSIDVMPVTLEQGDLALSAFMTFGKGRHPAKLNISDCFSYALAKSRNVPLLFKGHDFTRTDIVPAWRP